MTDAPPTADAVKTAGPQDQRPSRSAGLLGLLNRLLDHGRGMLATLRQRNTPDVPLPFAHRFGAISLAVVIARITRGVILATALRDHVARHARGLDAAEHRKSPQPSNRETPRPRRPRPARPALPEDENAELDNLPSAEEIAARIRNRPIGAVIVEICRDLGIDGEHELWREVCQAITFNGGNVVQVLHDTARCIRRVIALRLEPVPLPPRIEAMLAAGQGPFAAWATPPP